MAQITDSPIDRTPTRLGSGSAAIIRRGALAAAVLAACLSALPAFAQNAQVQMLERVESLEESIKEIRQILEVDIRALRQSVEGGGSLSGQELDDLRSQLAAIDSRLERTLGVASDNEFRLLRLEKRLDSLLRIGIEQSLSNTADPAGGPRGIGAGETPSASLNAEVDQETLWTIDKEALERELEAGGSGGDAGNSQADAGESIELASVDPGEASDSILPEGDIESQYQFALGKALQNDLGTAEDAFSEFIDSNPNHDRIADASFWLGRVQFMRGSYEQAVGTFSDFQTQWPNDSRVEKTTLWIGESVANFATQDEACEFLESLPALVTDPTDSFDERLAKLKTSTGCPE